MCCHSLTAMQRLILSFVLLLGFSPALFSQSPLYKQITPSKELGGEGMLPPRYSLAGFQKALNRDVLSSSYSTTPPSFSLARSGEESYDASPTADVRLIVQFKSPALGNMSAVKGRQRSFNVISAHKAMHTE